MTVRLKFLIASLGFVALSGCQSSSQQATVEQPPKPVAVSRTAEMTATALFVEACVKTADQPNAAAASLKALGFKPTGKRKGRLSFSHPIATASLSLDRQTNSFGQCTVTPKAGNFGGSVAGLIINMPKTGIKAQKLGGEAAWVLLRSRSVVLVSRSKGAMTRTQSGVFKG